MALASFFEGAHRLHVAVVVFVPRGLPIRVSVRARARARASMGTSPRLLQAGRKRVKPIEDNDLSALRVLLSTGSPLMPEVRLGRP